MTEAELFELLEHTADAAYAVTGSGDVCSWNHAAAELFGYAPAEALGRNIDELLDARDHLGTQPLAGGLESATRSWPEGGGGIPAFELDVRTASGARAWVSVSTILFDAPRNRRRLFVRLARDVTARRRRAELSERVLRAARELSALAGDSAALPPVEALTPQELRILRGFANGGTQAAIARALHISPQTLRNHLHHINRKLRTHSRLEAVVHARRHGLID